MEYTKEYEIELYTRLSAMTDEEHEALDPIVEALQIHVSKNSTGLAIIPNRITALMALDCHRARTKVYLEGY